MNRKLALKIVLVIVGVLFVALVYPLAVSVRQSPVVSMMCSIYVTLGIFLLLAVRSPSGSRNLILFTAWSSFAHAAVMYFQTWRHMLEQRELIGASILVVIGVALLALAPAKLPKEQETARGVLQTN